MPSFYFLNNTNVITMSTLIQLKLIGNAHLLLSSPVFICCCFFCRDWKEQQQQQTRVILVTWLICTYEASRSLYELNHVSRESQR